MLVIVTNNENEIYVYISEHIWPNVPIILIPTLKIIVYEQFEILDHLCQRVILLLYSNN